MFDVFGGGGIGIRPTLVAFGFGGGSGLLMTAF